jgi:Kdo2-lipid IVA lauroyltransferase/acyltransferase
MRLLLAVLDEVFRVLSWETAQDFGAFCGRAATLFARKRWRTSLGNLAKAFPEKTDAERRAIGLEAWGNAGRVAAEFIKSRSMTREELERAVVYENLDFVDEILAEGKGAVFNIAHLGNWEVAGISYTARGRPVGAIGRIMKDPHADRWLNGTRSRLGMSVIGHRNPFFSAVKWLKQGKPLCILIDHNLYEGGVFVPFFGRPAATSTISGLLAVKLGCPILSARVWREGRTIRVRFEGPIRADPKAADPEKEAERLTAEMARVIEGFVRDRPGEWLWGHNRWKRQPT